jgi:hypothetical protein
MPEDHDNNGKDDLTIPSNEKNTIHPTTIDQLPETLHKMVEEKNAANLAAALPSCLMDRRSSGVATQFKTLNITTLISLTTAAPGNTTCK